ncbi:acyltransferase [Nocardioides cavernae]|uniref:Acyltransferase n=1 Tax=Nocardioides cavernae TaxID=1921566 RepID=A0ABR8NEU2_9ACTN|nr:acyltransferase [Nocardioides cavernae]MBD3926652.1 acyltransferase [Nocardioides cavernae]MBM7512374.1 peptidoglycan/LPS O-acetylase OafA/YrhL [Nocardioides cavernae]
MPASAAGVVHAPSVHWWRGVRLGDRLGSKDNNFDLLRLLAAWAVLVSHSYALVGRDQPLHQFGTSLGNLGVLVFFAVSGLLIRRSWEHDPNPRDFWAKRALRLLPALAVTAVLTAFVLGPAVTGARLETYFTSWETWLYPVRLVLMVPFGAGLPEVFDDNVYAGAVNGSLWSLPLEVLAYAAVAGLGVLGVLAHRWVVSSVAVASILWAAWWVPSTSDAVGSAYVLSAFAVGAAAFTWRDRVLLSSPVALLLLGACLVTGLGPTSLRVVTWTVATVYLTYWFAYALPRVGRTVTRFGDTSYGLYIWAFPIQQVVVLHAGNDANPWLVTAIATPVVWLLALASWRLVERPALRHKPRPVPTGPGRR